MRKILPIVCMLIALAVAVLDLTYCDRIEPDEVYPMANAGIRWEHEKNP